jgi:hypothetical protein
MNNRHRLEDSNELPRQLFEHFQGIPANQINEILLDIQQLADAKMINMFEGFNQRTLLGEKYFVGRNFRKLRQILHL